MFGRNKGTQDDRDDYGAALSAAKHAAKSGSFSEGLAASGRAVRAAGKLSDQERRQVNAEVGHRSLIDRAQGGV